MEHTISAWIYNIITLSIEYRNICGRRLQQLKFDYETEEGKKVENEIKHETLVCGVESISRTEQFSLFFNNTTTFRSVPRHHPPFALIARPGWVGLGVADKLNFRHFHDLERIDLWWSGGPSLLCLAGFRNLLPVVRG